MVVNASSSKKKPTKLAKMCDKTHLGVRVAVLITRGSSEMRMNLLYKVQQSRVCIFHGIYLNCPGMEIAMAQTYRATGASHVVSHSHYADCFASHNFYQEM